MHWPLMLEPRNQLDVEVVPITLLLDEGGVIRFRNPSAEDLAKFLETRYQSAGSTVATPPVGGDLTRLRSAAREAEVAEVLDVADQLVLWGEAADLELAIGLYGRHLDVVPDHGRAAFRAGVAYRKRYDSTLRKDGDFQQASSHWTRALELNPNQYIWRRRIPQYGPRLEKPYAFFDWVEQARREIRDRGGEPPPLRVEPRGAELSSPVVELASSTEAKEPDPLGRIVRDTRRHVLANVTTVPAVARPGGAVRVHVELRPNPRLQVHWNNEVAGVEFWVEPSAGTELDRRHQQLSLPAVAVSTETRAIEFELRIAEDVRDAVELDSYALYYVCEDRNGVCLFRRLDIPVRVELSR